MKARRIRASRYPRTLDDLCPLCGGYLDLTFTCVECDTHYKRPGEFGPDEEDGDADYLYAECVD